MSEDKERLKLVVAEEQLDAEEEEFRKLRRDLPGVKGAAATGIVSITVAKTPGRNEFFRTHPHPDFQPVFDVVDHVNGLEKIFCVVAGNMVAPLASIGIIAKPYRMYFTQTADGKLCVVPVICEDGDGARNEYPATKEIGLREGQHRWVRLWTDQVNRNYRTFAAPEGRYPDKVEWPELAAHKVFSLAFKSKGRLIDSTDHALYLKWAARDKADQ
jgi:hypothetical protein